MATGNIPLDKAVLWSMLFESLLYGFSLPLFGGTIWTLCNRRTTSQVNRRVLAVSCALLLCSTAHFVLCVIRITSGLILLRDTFPGGPIEYFADVSQWTFVSMNYLYHIQTLIGDGVIIYRCYVVWQSKLVMIVPGLFWCAVAVTGIVTPYAESVARQNGVFVGSVSKWITAFWTSTLVTNLFTTVLLAYRIWRIDRKTTRLLGNQKSELRPILRIVLDAGLIYTVTLLVAIIFFLNRSNVQYVILNMIAPIIAITFYMVIIRVALANPGKKPTNTQGLMYTATEQSRDRRSGTHTMAALVENIDHGWALPTSPRRPTVEEPIHHNERKLDDIAEVV